MSYLGNTGKEEGERRMDLVSTLLTSKSSVDLDTTLELLPSMYDSYRLVFLDSWKSETSEVPPRSGRGNPKFVNFNLEGMSIVVHKEYLRRKCSSQKRFNGGKMVLVVITNKGTKGTLTAILSLSHTRILSL